MDEKSMILEQERQERAKKRKKRKKYKWIAAIITVVLVAGGTWYVGWGRYLLAEQESDAVEIKVSAGQNVVYAKITAINGNEITYAVAEKMDIELPENGETDGENRWQTGENRQQGARNWQQNSNRNVQSGEESAAGAGEQGFRQSSEGNMGFGGRGQREEGTGEMPGMGSRPEGSGEMPDMSQIGNMPSGGGYGMGQMGGFEQMSGFSQMGGNRNNTNTVSARNTNMFTYEDAVYMVGEESVTTYIPVGTDVTTKLGTVTTFSRLSAGDCIAIVTEEDGDSQIIMAVYIIG